MAASGPWLGWTKARQVAQTELALVEVCEDGVAYEYAALVTSLCDEIRTLAQQYRDRADAENIYDELKNQWAWGGGLQTRNAGQTLLALTSSALSSYRSDKTQFRTIAN